MKSRKPLPKVKKCPFCKATDAYYNSYFVRVVCTGCGARGPGPFAQRRGAVLAWNRDVGGAK